MHVTRNYGSLSFVKIIHESLTVQFGRQQVVSQGVAQVAQLTKQDVFKFTDNIDNNAV